MGTETQKQHCKVEREELSRVLAQTQRSDIMGSVHPYYDYRCKSVGASVGDNGAP